HCGAGLLHVSAALDGRHDLQEVLRQDGLLALHAACQLAAADGLAAVEDGAAVGVRLEIHHQHPRVLLELLILRRRTRGPSYEQICLPPSLLGATRSFCTWCSASRPC